jgi:ribonucleotide reductase alpha subunit
MNNWSNLASVVYARTYSRNDFGKQESWKDTVERYVTGNVKGFNVPEQEIKDLIKFGIERKACPAGRGIWFSGSPAHEIIGGTANVNCWFLTSDDWYNLVIAQDLLMLGGGVGWSIEHKYTSKLPRVKNGVCITHKHCADADFIVPDSRQGWCELLSRTLESYFVTGKSFSYSTICIRPSGEIIKGFGGISSGPKPLIEFIDNIGKILKPRVNHHPKPIDMMDIICACGQMVVSGNVRRSAIMVIGDAFDKDFLKSKRWSLGNIPNWRAFANLSVVCDDVDNDLSPLFWKTYSDGEPFGLINRNNIQRYGRMGEEYPDTAIGTNPCVSADTLVLTKDGHIRIDSLCGKTTSIWNGFEWSSVTPQVTGFNQHMVTVELSSGQKITCTDYHKFIVSIGYSGKTREVRAIDLHAGDKLVKHNYPVIEGLDDEESAYTQGFLSGDGMDGYSHLVLYGEKYKCKDRMKLRKIGNYDSKQDRTSVYFNFTPKPKSFVPFNWKVKSRLDWFAGLIDSDGVVLKEGGIQIASVDKSFLLKVQLMLSTTGVSSKVSLLNNSGYKSMPDGKGGKKEYLCQTSYRLLVGSVEMQFLIGLGLYCNRAKITGFNPQRNAGQFVRVVGVIESGFSEKVYCFNEPLRHFGVFNGILTGQCGEAVLEKKEPCNLQEIALMNIESQEEFNRAARLMHRYGKRVTCQRYPDNGIDEVIKRNRRVGTGITGCLGSSIFNPQSLDEAYASIQDENIKYSTELGIPSSIRTTVVKPSGTMSKVMDQMGYEGIHPAYSRYIIQRVRFASNDKLIPVLREAGHNIEPSIRFDGTLDQSTLVVDFYQSAPKGMPVADEDWGMEKQLNTLIMAQKHWSDQAVSVTVYYKKSEIGKIKEWLSNNWCNLKTISFLCANDHSFLQAPKEKITEQQFEKLSKKIKPIKFEDIEKGPMIEGIECQNGICPIR